MTDVRERIARRAAMELKDGMVINLGIGLPTMVSNYIPADSNIALQSENGILGMGAIADENSFNKDIVNAGGKNVTVTPGACFFDSAASFAIIRGGHVHLTILGALQVDETGTISNHSIPGRKVPGMGGAMDLMAGSRRVIVTMVHNAKDGTNKILERVSLPPTGINAVNMIITEMAVFEVTKNGLVVTEIAEGLSFDFVQEHTGAKLIAAEEIESF